MKLTADSDLMSRPESGVNLTWYSSCDCSLKSEILHIHLEKLRLELFLAGQEYDATVQFG